MQIIVIDPNTKISQKSLVEIRPDFPLKKDELKLSKVKFELVSSRKYGDYDNKFENRSFDTT